MKIYTNILIVYFFNKKAGLKTFKCIFNFLLDNKLSQFLKKAEEVYFQ